MFSHQQIPSVSEVGAIRVAGEVDMATMPMWEVALEALSRAAGDAVIDMADLTFIDVGGLRVLVLTSLAMSARGGRLSLRGVSPAIRRVMEVLGWAELFGYPGSREGRSHPQPAASAVVVP
ncbi:STAS domain-containing protein [Actinoplanes solisilvae]|uniref:STAS domain-containing protein n=1 Tax=Actinoplanes solisilvae TaxID=2486853 RepID=UPI000FDBE616|nr:STAS domain-containing protein [Actinoplanes solisilvae]